MITIQDSDSGYFEFSPLWKSLDDAKYDGHDAHVSTTLGDTVKITFPGKYIQLLGAKKPSYGSYDITLDGQPIFSGNATSQAELYHQPLFTKDNLEDKDHTLVVRNGGAGLDLDAIKIARGKSVWTTGPILIVASLAAFVCLTIILLGIFLWRRHRYRRLPEFDIINDSDSSTLFSTDVHDSKPPAYVDLENPPKAYLRGEKPRPVIPHLKTLRLKPDNSVTGLHRSTSDASTNSSVTIKVGEEKIEDYSYQPNILAYSARTHDESRLGVGRIDVPDQKRSLRPLSLVVSSKVANAVKNRRMSAQHSKTKRVSIPVGSPILFSNPPMYTDERLTSPISPNLSPDNFEDDFDARRKSSGLLGIMGAMGIQSARYHPVDSGPGASSPNPKQRRFSIVSPSLMPKFAKRVSDVREERSLYVPTTPLAPPPARLRSRSVTPEQGAAKGTNVKPAPASDHTVSNHRGQTHDRRRHAPFGEDVQAPEAERGTLVSLTPTASADPVSKVQELRGGIGGSSSILKSAVAKGKVTREEVECATGIVLSPYLDDDYR